MCTKSKLWREKAKLFSGANKCVCVLVNERTEFGARGLGVESWRKLHLKIGAPEWRQAAATAARKLTQNWPARAPLHWTRPTPARSCNKWPRSWRTIDTRPLVAPSPPPSPPQLRAGQKELASSPVGLRHIALLWGANPLEHCGLILLLLHAVSSSSSSSFSLAIHHPNSQLPMEFALSSFWRSCSTFARTLRAVALAEARTFAELEQTLVWRLQRADLLESAARSWQRARANKCWEEKKDDETFVSI